MKTYLSLTAFLLCITFSYSQTRDVQHLRIGAKVGFPNVITPSVEYVTHLWEDHIAFTADAMGLNQTIDDVGIKFFQFEIGSNLYFSPNGSGFYAGLSYFNFDGTGTYENVDFDDGTSGTGTGDIIFDTLNAKIGFKTGRSFYFRTEVGYGFGKIPQEIVVAGNNGSTTIEDIPSIPGMSSSGLILFNIGIGFAIF